MGRIKINATQLPIKAHFFFFMAAMGPILPSMTVYGKQLGVSPMVMGTVTAILPLLYLLSKPAFGYLVDYFRDLRKFIFIGLLMVTSVSLASLYFLPSLDGFTLNNENFNVTFNCDEFVSCESRNVSKKIDDCHGDARLAECHWYCMENEMNYSATVILTNREKNYSLKSLCLVEKNDENFTCYDTNEKRNCRFSCSHLNDDGCLYGSLTFWGFVILISLGSIGFNVSNSISDAICFDVLGERGKMGYGRQRVWGTIGFGVAAFFSGYVIDVWSEGQAMKTYAPAFILVIAFTCIDVLCCTKLELPIMSASKSIVKDVYRLFKMKPILIFLCFATMAGIFDSFIVYFMFWYLEDLAAITGHMGQIKLIEGSIVAAETLGGEVIFFSLSGKILKKFGYGYSFVFCFVCYSLRMGLISLAPNPWWVVPIEFFMQGPTYALCYTTIVTFASAIAPPGTSATVQGIVAGMDDGFGFAVGSLASGFLYENVGGAVTLRILSSLAGVSSIIYLLLHITYLKNIMPQTKTTSEQNRSISVEWKSPDEATRNVHSDNEAG